MNDERYEETEGGIVVPKKPEEKPKRPRQYVVRVFHCGCMDEFEQFIGLLAKAKAQFINASSDGVLLRGNYYITYRHHEAIDMVVMT